MDNRNLFETKATYRLLRLEYGVALLFCLCLAFVHRDEIRWWAFAALFIYIDLIGYIPGAIAYRRSKNGEISKLFYVLYNSMHSLVSGAAVAAIWTLFFGLEWALLAIPIHLFGDRALFGNFLKQFNVSFEPVVHPEFLRFQENYLRNVNQK